VATYSQVGAQFGFACGGLLSVFLPVMAAIQEICGRLGRITGMGVTANLAKSYPKSLVGFLVFTVVRSECL